MFVFPWQKHFFLICLFLSVLSISDQKAEELPQWGIVNAITKMQDVNFNGIKTCLKRNSDMKHSFLFYV